LEDEFFFEKNGKWKIKHFREKEKIVENMRRISHVLSHFKGEKSEIILKK
jgi:hypothetical protein